MKCIFFNAVRQACLNSSKLTRSLLLAGMLGFGTLPTANAAPITFNNGGANQIWSNNANWTPVGSPSGQDVTFNDTASSGTAGTVTNIVDSSFSINTLNYLNDNFTGAGVTPAKYHTTQINAGTTLTVNGAFTVGQANFVGTSVAIKGATTGVGTFTVNNAAANMILDPGGNSFSPGDTVLLDMQGLGIFNATVNRLVVGQFGGGTKTLILANSNTITANEINMGENGWNQTTSFQLGQTNILNTDTLAVNGTVNPQSSTSTMLFRAGLTNPTVQIRNKAGNGRANVVAGMRGHTSGTNTGTMNFNGGSVDALFNLVRLGIGSSGGGDTLNQARPGSGVLQFDTGTVDATTIAMGEAGIPVNLGATTGTVTIAGTGTLLADTINMTIRPAGTAAAATAVINLNGTGTLRATTIQRGTSVGSGAATINFNWSGGTIGNKVGANGTITADVPLSLLTSATHTFDVTTGRTLTVNSGIGGAGIGIVQKTSGGTLYLNGVNTYSGNTVVSAGTLGGTGSLAGQLVVGAGGTIAPGASAGAFAVGSANLQAGSIYSVEIGGLTPGTQYDQLNSAGSVTLSGDLQVAIINGFEPGYLDTFVIINASSVIGQFTNGSAVTVTTGGTFNIEYLNNQVVLTHFLIPEPSTFALLGLGVVGMAIKARRRRRVAA